MSGEEQERSYAGEELGYAETGTKFYLIPPIVLSRLYDDFSPMVGDTRTRLILQQSGYRCGCKMAEGLNINTDDQSVMESALQELLIQLGLGVLKLEEYSTSRIVITCGDANEARAMGKRSEPACNFTVGYIRGLLEILMGVRFKSHEEECVSIGAARCRYVFTWPE